MATWISIDICSADKLEWLAIIRPRIYGRDGVLILSNGQMKKINDLCKVYGRLRFYNFDIEYVQDGDELIP